jgi:hypothetical protein
VTQRSPATFFVVGVGVAVGVGFAFATTFTPLFQTNFLPDLTQVYLIPADVLIWPRVLQEVPGLTAAVELEGFNDRARHAINVVASNRFMLQSVAIG